MTPISIIIATRNRKDVLTSTLQSIRTCIGSDTSFDGDRAPEIIVVDNGSTDGTRSALAVWPEVTLLTLRHNLGSCAKALGAARARGEILVFLDDDALPRPGTLETLIRRFEQNPRLGAAGFTVHLPGGGRECSALPHVFVGCGVGIRADAYRRVGGLDRSFFMQAEEYDLSFRLLRDGWQVETFPDLEVDHVKTPDGARHARAAYFDIRNNLRIVSRYLSPPFRAIYRKDWYQRYAWLAEDAGYISEFKRGARAGRIRAVFEQRRFRDERLSAQTLEDVFRWTFIRDHMEALRQDGVERIVLADLGKNVYAFHRGAREAGLDVVAIADDRFCSPDRTYRDVKLITTRQALSCPVDAYVVSNTSIVHATQRKRRLTELTDRPVYNWFEEPQMPSITDTDDQTITREATGITPESFSPKPDAAPRRRRKGPTPARSNVGG